MSCGKRAAIAAVTAALALPAAASAKEVTYVGEMFPDGRIAVDVAVNKKKPKRVVEIRAVEVPADCAESGPLAIWTRLPTGGLVVNKRRFTYKSKQPTYGNVKKVTGKFSKRNKLLEGAFTYSHHFPAEDEYPEEDCRADTLRYSAKRGAKDFEFPPPDPAERRG